VIKCIGVGKCIDLGILIVSRCSSLRSYCNCNYAS